MLKYFSNEFDWLMIKRDATKIIDEEVKTNAFLSGKQCKQFVKNLSYFIGCKYVLLTKSGTQALEIALKAYGIGKGDKVITTPLTFIATVSAIKSVGAEPVFVDVKKDTWNIDENKIEEQIDDNVKAIMNVDIFGNPCNYDKLLEISKKYNIKLISDSCQSLTSEYNGKKIGNIADVTCFSFYPTKPFGGFGEGGAISTNDIVFFEIAKRLLDHGSENNDTVCVGTNGAFDMLQGVYLNVKMKYINDVLRKRNEVFDIYKQMKNVVFQLQEKNAVSAWCRIQAYVDNEYNMNLIKDLFETDDLYSKDICDNTMYQHLRKLYPISKDIVSHTISLPIYNYINKSELKKTIEVYNSKAV